MEDMYIMLKNNHTNHKRSAGLLKGAVGLTAAGYDTDGTDGKIGPNTSKAIVAYQRAKGLAPDGYATLELLQTLR